MKVAVSETSPGERVLTVTLSEEAAEKAYSQAFQERRKLLKLKGFRKGNVPEELARKHIKDSHLVNRVINLALPPAYREAVKGEKLSPLGKPSWRIVQSERGKELIFEATIQVMPTLELSGYRGYQVKRPPINISSNQVEDIIEQRRQGVARYVDLPSDHSAAVGDYCFIDYALLQKDKPVPGSSVSDFMLEMSHDKFLPGFVKNLLGMKVGESREFSLKLPENYAQQSLAGEEATFRVKLNTMKERRLPPLDDVFAKTHCKADSLQHLKQRVHRNLETQVRKKIEQEIVNEIVSKLASEISPDIVPSQLREGHAHLALRTQTRRLQEQGLSLQEWLDSRGTSSEHFSEELNLTGLVEARLEILYRSLAKAEGVVVTNKDLDQAIGEQAKTARMSPQELKARLQRDDTLKLLVYRLLIQKIRTRLLELAEIEFESTDERLKPKAVKKKSTKKKRSAAKSKSKPKAKSKAKGAKKKAPSKAKSKAKAKSNTKTKAKSTRSKPKSKGRKARTSIRKSK